LHLVVICFLFICSPFHSHGQAPKYTRSFHDFNASACVYRFDHYNKYARVPVGARNYRSFIFFMVCQSINLLGLAFNYYRGVNAEMFVR
jgi:hypothetical protein